MSADEYYDESNESEIYDRMCECGHRLYIHANIMQYNYSTGQQYLHVGICTGPDEKGKENFCSCKEFRRK